MRSINVNFSPGVGNSLSLEVAQKSICQIIMLYRAMLLDGSVSAVVIG